MNWQSYLVNTGSLINLATDAAVQKAYLSEAVLESFSRRKLLKKSRSYVLPDPNDRHSFSLKVNVGWASFLILYFQTIFTNGAYVKEVVRELQSIEGVKWKKIDFIP